MNILILHSQVPFFRGGAETLVEGLRGALEERDHRVDVVALPMIWNPPESLLTTALSWRLTDLTQSNGVSVDLVICTKYPTWAVRHPHKVLWLIHQHRQAYDLFGTENSEFGPDSGSRETQRRVLEIDRRGMLECRRRFAISQNVAHRLCRYSGIDALPLYPPVPRDGLRADGYDAFVLSVARLDRLKRVDRVVDAWPLVDPRLRLVIASDGPDLPQLKQRVAELGLQNRVEFTGRVSDEELTALFNRCRAVYYAPIDEDYGYAAVEALTARKPVITAPDSGGVLEFVEHEHTGVVTELEPEPLAAEINRLVDERLARRLGERGPALTRELTWDRVVNMLLGSSD